MLEIHEEGAVGKNRRETEAWYLTSWRAALLFFFSKLSSYSWREYKPFISVGQASCVIFAGMFGSYSSCNKRKKK